MHPRAEPELPTSLRLPFDLKKKLIEHAVKRRQPLSAMIVFILEQWLAQQDQKK